VSAVRPRSASSSSGLRRLSLRRSQGPAPPEDVEADHLFRVLAAPAGARLLLDFRLDFAPDVPLWLRGLTGAEDAAAFRSAATDAASGFQGEATARHLIAAALCDSHGAPLLSYGQAGDLTTNELEALGSCVLDGLARISPAYWRCNVDAWNLALKRGAAHFSNIPITIQIGLCHDVNAGLAVSTTPRPDRFYGRPIAQLTDGQLMAFAAARVAYSEIKA
jgi:hypothetical protein